MSNFREIPNYPNYKVNGKGDVMSKFNDNILKPIGGKYTGQYVKLYDNDRNFQKVYIKDLTDWYYTKTEKTIYYVYYKTTETEYRLYEPVCKQFSTKDALGTKEYIMFHTIKGYESNDEDLVRFANDFQKDCDELKKATALNIHYEKYYNHNSAVEMTFKRLCKGLYEDHDNIDIVEAGWMNKCFNSGLQYCKAGTYKSYGYDFSAYYPLIMADDKLLIPCKKGKEMMLKKLPKYRDDLEFGFYRVSITCQNDDFRKIFSRCLY